MNTALRPLTIGEILDRTFTYYRRHFLLFVTIAAVSLVATLLIQIPQAVVGQFWRQDLSGVAIPLTVGYMIVLVAVFLFAMGLMQAATAFAVSELQLERGISATVALVSVQPILVRVVLLSLNVLLRLMVIVVPVGLLSALVVAGARANGTNAAIGAALTLLVLLPITVFAVCWMWLRYSLAIPVLVLERTGVNAALARSVVLTKGHLGRIFLIYLLFVVLVTAVTMVIQMPALVALVIASMKNANAPTDPPVWLAMALLCSSYLAQTLTAPIATVAGTILYYDERVRKEAFDLRHLMSGLETTTQTPPAI